MQLIEYSFARTEIGDQKVIDARYQEVEKRQISIHSIPANCSRRGTHP